MKPYTYLIKFLPTGQCYYGSRYKHTTAKHPRTAEEDLMLHYQTSSKYIKEMIANHGIEKFAWEVRRKFNSPKEAVAWEKKVLRRCNVLGHQDKWLNRNIAGHILATAESAKKISEFHKDKPKSEEHRHKISAANKGKSKPPQTAEHRLKNSLANSGTNNPMYGVPCTAERAAKIGAANKGKSAGKGHLWTDEQKKEQSKKMKGRKMLPDQIAKRVASQIGKKRSEEAKQKISLALKGKPKGPMSTEHKEKIAKRTIGVPKSEESTIKKAATLKALASVGRHHSQRLILCPHCGVEFKTMTYARWHGDNCKMKGKQDEDQRNTH